MGNRGGHIDPEVGSALPTVTSYTTADLGSWDFCPQTSECFQISSYVILGSAAPPGSVRGGFVIASISLHRHRASACDAG